MRGQPRDQDDVGLIVPAGGGKAFSGEDFESRLVWILGSPRTGSTWLLRLLAHPVTVDRGPAGFTTPRRYGFDSSSVIPINEPYLPVHLTPQVGSAFDPGDRPDPEDYLQTSIRSADPSYFFSAEYESAWMPEVRRMTLVRLRAQVERGAGAAGADVVRVALKEPNGSHGAQLLMKAMPRSRMIFLIRDGREVIASLVKAHAPGGWLEGRDEHVPLSTPERRRAFIAEQAQLWVLRSEAVERAFRAHPAHLRYELHYEEMTSAPRRTFERVLAWLELERAPEEIDAALEAGSVERPERTSGAWEDALTDAEREVALSIMRFKLDELGYAT